MTDDLELSKKSFTQIAALQSTLVIGILLATGWAVRQRTHQVYLDSMMTELSDSAEILYKQLPKNPSDDWCTKTADQTRLRLTVISSITGKAICDNAYPLSKLPDSLLDRPEIVEAMHTPEYRGRVARKSVLTRDLERAYFAIYAPERSVILRTGMPLTKLQETLASIDRLFAGSILLISILIVTLLMFTSRRIGYASAARAMDRTRRKMQDDFVANVSHEFRTPLTSIRGFASTIRGDLRAKRPIEPEFVDIILKDSDRLLGMVEELLELTALDSGSVKIEKDELDPRDITEDVIKRLSVVYANKNQKVIAHYDTDTVYADPNRLTQILTNLVGNSQNHCPPGTQVRIRWSKENNRTILTVEDNGPGIPASAQARVFDRFVRVDDAGVKSRGTGLGLPIVLELVKTHGGDIRLESTPGQGTRFVASFPTENR